MGIYSIQDLEKPIKIHAFDANPNLLESVINAAFAEDLPYACIDDLPYVQYDPDTGKVEIESDEYNVTPELQEYLNDFNQKLNTIPIKKIRLKPVILYTFHPDENNEGEIGIEKYIED